MSKPRLLIILNRLSTGGPATNVLSSAALLSSEYDILLIAGEPLSHEQSAEYLLDEYSGFTVEMLSSLRRSVMPGKDIAAYNAIKKRIKSFQPDIVHTHGAKPGLLGRIAARRCRVPVIIHTFHGHIFHSYFNALLSKLVVYTERILAGISTSIIAINEKLQNELLYDYKITGAEKIKLVRLGVETSKFIDENGSRRKMFRNEYHLNEDEIAVGIVGRLVPVKNHKLFVQAAENVLLQNKAVRFFIIGDGPEKTGIQQLLQEKQLAFTCAADEESVKKSPFVFTSWRKDMEYVFAGLDIITLTSLNEGSPVSIMEAMAAGKPVVSTPAGGVRELIQDGETGLIAEDAAAIAAGILALSGNEQKRSDMGNRAVLFAQKEFSKAAEINKLKAVYTLVLTKSQNIEN